MRQEKKKSTAEATLQKMKGLVLGKAKRPNVTTPTFALEALLGTEIALLCGLPIHISDKVMHTEPNLQRRAGQGSS